MIYFGIVRMEQIEAQEIINIIFLGLFLGLLHLIWEVFSIFNNSYVIGSIHVELLVSC